MLTVMPASPQPDDAAAAGQDSPGDGGPLADPIKSTNAFRARLEASVRGRDALLRQPSSKRIADLQDMREYSLFFLHRDHPVRIWAYQLITHPYFDRVIILLIVLNCAILALNDPLDEDETSTRSQIIKESELWFTILFGLEMVFKIIAMGFVGRFSYLSDRWNWLDFIVVVTGFVSLAPGVDNVSALRTFRVLRPLRTMTSIPGMRVIVQSMLASLPALGNVALLCCFIFFVFGIIGVQLWNGILRGRCTPSAPGGPLELGAPETFCALPCDDSHCTPTFGDNCPVNLPGMEPQTCQEFFNPSDGFVGFDNIGMACLTIFTSITLEGWVDVMYALNATWGVPVFNAVYFILLIMLGSFFMLNLALAVIWDEYVKADEREQEKRKAEEERAEEVEREELEFEAKLMAEEAAAAAALEASFASGAGTGDATGDATNLGDTSLSVGNGAGTGAAHLPSEAPPTPVMHLEPPPAAPGSRRSSLATHTTRHTHPPAVEYRGCSPCYEIVSNKYFSGFIVGAILANTLVLAMEHHNSSETFDDVLVGINYVFTTIFLVEMVLKLVGLTPRGYVQSKFNIFDGVIVLISVVELVLEFSGAGGGGSGLSALRSFRLLRVFRLARSWPDLQILLTTIAKSIADVANASFVLAIIMFIFVLLGMQMFGGKIEDSRAHFDNLWWAFVTVFQVLTGENWNEVLYTTMANVGEAAVVYFVLLNIIGNYLILNLFLAILLGNFDSVDDEGNDKNSPEHEAMEARMVKEAAAAGAAPAGGEAKNAPGATAMVSPVSSVVERKEVPAGSPGKPKQHDPFGSGPASTVISASAVSVSAVSAVSNGGASTPRGTPKSTTTTVVPLPSPNAPSPATAATDEGDAKHLLPYPEHGEELPPHSWSDYSLYLFAPDSAVRVLAARIISNKWFETVILVLIAISSVMLALDEPRVEDCKDLPSSDSGNCIVFADFLYWMDVIITGLFVGEMSLKIISMGMWVNKHAYLRNGWNVLDFIIVVVSVLSLALGGSSQLKALRSLRALRALRPLRVVSRYPGLKLVVNSIFGALPRVRNVAMVNLLFFLIFAIVGVQNWAGAVNTCTDPEINEGGANECQDAPGCLAACTGEFVVPFDECGILPNATLVDACLDGEAVMMERYWGSRLLGPASFDNVFKALLQVFETATGERWPDYMYVTVDAVGADEPLRTDHNPAAALYFVFIQITVAFFLLEIFTGVVIDNFNRMKEQQQGSALLTKAQQMWVESMKIALSVSPARVLVQAPNASPLRVRVFHIARAKWFEVSIMVLIILNTLVMAVRHADQSVEWDDWLENINWFFTAVFTLEACVKLYGIGIRQYFSIGWNRFDFTLVIASYVGVMVGVPSVATLFRIFRVLRVFRLVRTSKGVLQLLRTLLFSIPSLLNVGAILLLIFFIYAIVAMNLFADIKFGEFLNDDANFTGFWLSMITLFRISTGESYNGIMHDCMVEEPFCDPDFAENCGFPVFAPLFFISYYMLTAFILLNLLVAIILDNFSDTVALDEEKDVFTLTDEMVTHFREQWSKLDPDATRYIPATSMHRLILLLNYPLGLANTPGVEHGRSLRRAARDKLKNLDVPEVNGNVQFHAVLQALTNDASGNVELPDSVMVTRELNAKRRRLLKDVDENSEFTLKDNIAAQMLQSVFRAHQARKSPRMRRVVEMRMTRHRRDKIETALDEPATPTRRVAFEDEVVKPPEGDGRPDGGGGVGLPSSDADRGSVDTVDL